MITFWISRKSHLLPKLLKSGEFVCVTFIKKDGSERKLTGRAKVAKHTKNGVIGDPERNGMVLL